MEITTWDQVPRTLKPLMQDLETVLDPQAYQAEVDAELADTRRMLRYQPDALARAEELAKAKIAEAWATKAGQLAYTLDMVTHTVDQQLGPIVQQATSAPPPATAWYLATGKIATEDQQVQLSQLDEQVQARLDREASTISPAAVRSRYEAALRTPYDQLSASVIRWTESRHAGGWSGRAMTPAEALAGETQKLQTVMAATRRGRLSKDATEALEVPRKARATVARATDSRIGRAKVRKEVTFAWKDLVK